MWGSLKKEEFFDEDHHVVSASSKRVSNEMPRVKVAVKFRGHNSEISEYPQSRKRPADGGKGGCDAGSISLHKRVTGRQLSILWDFLNTNRDLASAFNRSLEAKEYSKSKWSELTKILNAIPGGVHKDQRNWTKYWIDYKAKLKKRVVTFRSSYASSGGEPSTELTLSDVDRKFLQILGEDFGQAICEPPEINTTSSMPFSPAPESISNDSVILDPLKIQSSTPLTNHTSQLSTELAPFPHSPNSTSASCIALVENVAPKSSTQLPMQTIGQTPVNTEKAPHNTQQTIHTPLNIKMARQKTIRPTQVYTEVAPQYPVITEMAPHTIQQINTEMAPNSPKSTTSSTQSLSYEKVAQKSSTRRNKRPQQKITQEMARRTLVRSSIKKANAANRNARGIERMAHSIERIANSVENMQSTLLRIERSLSATIAGIDEQQHFS